MYSSRNNDLVLAIYNDQRTVFTLNDIALLIGESDFNSLNKRIHYFVGRGKLQRPRKGVYVKKGYNPEELACKLYTPSYISLQYILQEAGVVFQFDSTITSISYLSRTVEIEENRFSYRKIKGEIMVNTNGIFRDRNINKATVERAFLDTLYLNGDFYFDNLNPLDRSFVHRLLPIYDSKALTARVKKILTND
jgi:hypothetical protein